MAETKGAVCQYPFSAALEATRRMDELREESALSRVRLPSGDEVWFATRYEDVKAVLSDPQFARNLGEDGGPRMTAEGDFSENSGALVSLDGEEHARRRRPVQGHLNRRRVAEMRPDLEALTDRFLDRLVEHGPPVDLMAEFAVPLPAVFVAKLLGVPDEDLDFFQKHSVVLASPDQHTGEEIAASFGEVNVYASDLIAKKRENPCDDILTALVQAQDAGQLIEWEVQVSVYELMFAGYVTTTCVLGSGLLMLASDPTLLAAAVDPDVLRSLVEEVIRLYPPADNAMLRVALQDTSLAGQEIKRGDGVLVALLPANRDPRAYGDADAFDAKRFLRSSEAPHLSFGHGAHFCVGAGLARLELEVALGALSTRLPGLRLAVSEDDLAWRYGLFERRLDTLPAVW